MSRFCRFFYRFFGNEPLKIEKGNNDGFYIKMATSSEDDIFVELWYEDWTKEKKGKVFSICLEYSNEKLFKEHFPEWEHYKECHKDFFEIESRPDFNDLFFQKDADNHYFAGVYIDPDDELGSLQRFFENEKINKIIKNKKISFSDPGEELATQRIQQVLARVGQGKYRDDMLNLWDKACSVTGCTIKESLVASHAKPWRDCKPAEKINARNGLLLAAHLDALFDKFLITFDEDWKIKIAPHLESECKRIGITPEMMVKYEKLKKQDQAEVQNFLKEHRRRFNEKQKS